MHSINTFKLSKSYRIAVLLGGLSAEREVSLTSGKGVVEALRGQGYQNVTPIDVGADIALKLHEAKPDVIFNALHGKYGEDGTIQGLLDIMRIPYTHSGVLASALAMNKPQAKKIFEAAGIPTAVGKIVSKQEIIASQPMERPFVVKPIDEGSSVGVQIIHENDPFQFDENNWQFGEKVLVEQYIKGREIQVAVFGEGDKAQSLGAIEIRPKQGFYDYAAKYTGGLAEHLMPAPISTKDYDTVMNYALLAHNALGCRGVTRSDFRFDDDPQSLTHGIYILETNTQPGMTPLSLTPEIAAYKGISYSDLIENLLKEARYGD
jgi:D-alanine-D-alanine ligase